MNIIKKILKTKCFWKTYYIDDTHFETECNNQFDFNSGDTNDNGFIYCPFCGLKILLIKNKYWRTR